ncbi:MAG: hypothetical protein H7Z72_18605 [Bacteroidetes bacterium]|nr:hypothetical protein [Fibrella sp.]
MYRFIRFVFCTVISSASVVAFGQSGVPVQLSTEVGAYGSTAARTPFWLRTNQWGSSPLKSPAGTLRLGISRAWQPVDSLRRHRVRFTFGAEVVGNLNRDQAVYGRQQVLIPEAFAAVRWRSVELWAGRRRQITGIVDTLLSSGSFAVSDNALPIPKIELATAGYVPLHFLGDAVAFKASFAHGLFNVPYINRAFFHQKSAYVRFGRPRSPIQVQVGLNHQVQWGGEGDYLREGIYALYAVDGRLTSNFNDYLNSVVLGFIPSEWTSSRFTSFDGANRVGNHIGSIDAAVSLNRQRGAWLLYHQHPYEDASGTAWRNFPDGLYGLSWQAKTGPVPGLFWQWRRVVGEVLTTKDQSGSAFNIAGQMYKGADNYYNHGQYREGWSYFRQTIGTPFLVPRPDIARQEPLLPLSDNLFFPYSRVMAYYTAFEALAGGRATVQGRFSFSQNRIFYGGPGGDDNPLSQFSGMVRVSLPLRSLDNTTVSGALAVDQGRLLNTAVGGTISLRRTW